MPLTCTPFSGLIELEDSASIEESWQQLVPRTEPANRRCHRSPATSEMPRRLTADRAELIRELEAAYAEIQAHLGR